MDLNPVFTDATSFHPSTTLTGAGGELKLFQQVGISLLHGWLVDPDSPEAPVLRRVQDYDSAVGLIAEVDHLTNGKFVVDDQAPHDVQPDPTSPTREWTDEELQKVKDGQLVVIIHLFLHLLLFHLFIQQPSFAVSSTPANPN
jgi:hypothetical protein